MGVLKKAIKSFDPVNEKKDEINLSLDLLFGLASAKCELFRNKVEQNLRTAGTENNPTIPITNMLAYTYDTRAYVKDDASKIIKEVTDSIKLFVDGGSDNIINGVSSLLATGITALLGAGEGSEQERYDYYIMVEGLSIVRLDVQSWVKYVNVKGITHKIEHVMAFTAVKSSIDVNKITFNTFLEAYRKLLQKANLPNSDLIKEIKSAKEVYELLKESNGPLKLKSAAMSFDSDQDELKPLELSIDNMILPGEQIPLPPAQ